ncbi:MAG: hypothetical protein MRJ65_04090 [Candidatus Brocadiaceae bacterium]|nr:hypothetical protein [Candidatus Brocadiaceae bacterium]
MRQIFTTEAQRARRKTDGRLLQGVEFGVQDGSTLLTTWFRVSRHAAKGAKNEVNTEFRVWGFCVHEASETSFFITCDDKIFKRYNGKIEIKNPVEFIITILKEDKK